MQEGGKGKRRRTESAVECLATSAGWEVTNIGVETFVDDNEARDRFAPSKDGLRLSQELPQRSRIKWYGQSVPEGISPGRDQRSASMLENLLGLPIHTFENEYWLKKPYVRRLTEAERAKALKDPSHPLHMITLEDIKNLLKRKKPRPAKFLHDVDVVKWHGGSRISLSRGDGPVHADKVWAAFNNKGYSIRMVHPQQWHPPLYELCSVLQEYFGFTVGCSSYLTPGKTQGFGPHYDDVEIFVCQLVGEKRWRLYDRQDRKTNPRTTKVTGVDPEKLGEPILDLKLKAGDVMYFPRGTVHQAFANTDEESLHLTFSTYQSHTWYDLIERAVGKDNRGIMNLLEHTPGLIHKDLPRNLLSKVNISAPERAWAEHGSFLNKAKLPKELLKYLSKPRALGRAIDDYAVTHLDNCLPPPIVERADRTCKTHKTLNLTQPLSLRLSFKGSAWLCRSENDEAAILHTNIANGISFGSEPSPRIEVLPHCESAVRMLIEADENGVVFQELAETATIPCDKEDLVNNLELWCEHGLIEIV